MPYKLRGKCVVRSDTGAVVKCHGSDEDARKHLAALKINVSEGALGSLLEGFEADAGPVVLDGRVRPGDRVRVDVKGAESVVGRVVRPSDAKPDHVLVAPEGGGPHVEAPVKSVGHDTPERQAAEQARRRAEQETERQLAASPEAQAAGALRAMGSGVARVQPEAQRARERHGGAVAEGVAVLLENFNPGEPRGFHGRWLKIAGEVAKAGGGGTRPLSSDEGEFRRQLFGAPDVKATRDVTPSVGPAGAAARAGGASDLSTIHADTRDALASLPVGQRYGLHGPQGQVGHVERTSAGFSIEPGGRTAKSPSAAAGHARRVERRASSSPEQARVMAGNYRAGREVAGMNARQASMARMERMRGNAISAGARPAGETTAQEIARKSAGAQAELDQYKAVLAAARTVPGVTVGATPETVGTSVYGHPVTRADVTGRFGGFQVGDPVDRYRQGVKQGPGEVVGYGRNGNLVVREPQYGTTVHDHHSELRRRRVRQGTVVSESVLEGFLGATYQPRETPAQSRARAKTEVAQAKSGIADFNAKHPRAGHGRFTTKSKTASAKSSTSSKRATRATAGGPRILTVGTKGTLVRSIQRQLHLPATGTFDARTQAAIERYQRQHHLLVDGKVGAQTIASLRGNPNARKIAPGPIPYKTARVANPHKRASRAKPKAAAPVRYAGGVAV